MKIDDKKDWGHQTDENATRQESATEFPVNDQLFEALLSQVDETIWTTQTAASGRNGMDLGLFPSRCLRCHQRGVLQDPSTRVLWPESRTCYSDRRFNERIGCRIAARRKTSDLRIQNSHSRRGTLFQHREGLARSGVRHGEASQLCVWWTSQSSNITNLWKWFGRRVLPLPARDFNDFFWGLQDTKFKSSTSVGMTTQLQTSLVETTLSVQSLWTQSRWMWFQCITSLQMFQLQTTDLTESELPPLLIWPWTSEGITSFTVRRFRGSNSQNDYNC